MADSRRFPRFGDKEVVSFGGCEGVYGDAAAVLRDGTLVDGAIGLALVSVVDDQATAIQGARDVQSEDVLRSPRLGENDVGT